MHDSVLKKGSSYSRQELSAILRVGHASAGQEAEMCHKSSSSSSSQSPQQARDKPFQCSVHADGVTLCEREVFLPSKRLL